MWVQIIIFEFSSFQPLAATVRQSSRLFQMELAATATKVASAKGRSKSVVTMIHYCAPAAPTGPDCYLHDEVPSEDFRTHMNNAAFLAVVQSIDSS